LKNQYYFEWFRKQSKIWYRIQAMGTYGNWDIMKKRSKSGIKNWRENPKNKY
jgi:hypothetical protein